MKLSIIIPVYNVEPYLRECLNSILEQDFDEFEVICIDDKSDDNSLCILKEYEQMYDNLKIIQHEENRGLSAARNTGISVATGEFIQFVDSDDMIKPSTCKILYQYAKLSELDVLYFNMEFMNNEKQNLYREQQNNRDFSDIYEGVELFCKFQEYRTPKPEAVRHFINREFLLKNELKFKEGIIHEDALFSFQVAMKARRVADLNKELYIYRQRANSISWSNQDKSASSILVCLINIISFWLREDFSTYENQWIYKYIESLYKNYLYHLNFQNSTQLVEDTKDKMILNMLRTSYCNKILFSEKDIIRMKSSSKNIVYGAGRKAIDVLKELKQLNIPVYGIAVSDIAGNPKQINGVEVKSIMEYQNIKNAQIILGIDKKYEDEVIKTITQYRFDKSAILKTI